MNVKGDNSIIINFIFYSSVDLFWRTLTIGVGTENTTFSLFGFEKLAAVSAFVKKLAGVHRHFFFLYKTTPRAGNGSACFQIFIHILFSICQLFWSLVLISINKFLN